MPMIMASAVIITGLRRVDPASIAARAESLSSASLSLAKVITRTLLAVATPMFMMVPISAGTLKVVRVRNNIHAIPARAPGKAVITINASVHDWKFTTMSRYTRAIAKSQSGDQPDEG